MFVVSQQPSPFQSLPAYLQILPRASSVSLDKGKDTASESGATGDADGGTTQSRAQHLMDAWRVSRRDERALVEFLELEGDGVADTQVRASNTISLGTGSVWATRMVRVGAWCSDSDAACGCGRKCQFPQRMVQNTANGLNDTGN